jgi:hypothetical protein
MKWLFLISSMAFHTIMALLFIRLSMNGSGVPGIFGWFWVYWMAILFLSVIVFVLRLFNVVKRNSLIYICLGLGSLLMGIIGLFIGVGDLHRDLLWLCLYLTTIVLGLIMLSDTFVISLIGQKE